MYVIGILKEGFGNKLFMIMAYIMKFKKLVEKGVQTLYIVQTVSKHEEGLQCEKFGYIFPKLSEVPWLKLISWREYDALKTDAHEIFPVDFCFCKNDFLELKSFIKKYFVMNSKYDKLLDKYDTRKGIAIHVRLGDKFNINLNRLQKKQHENFLLLSPRYYVEQAQKLLSEKKGPLYIFSDSPKFAECLLKPYLPDAILIDENFVETFFLLTKFRRSVLSESTLGLAAGYMNFYKHQMVIPGYRIKLNGGTIQESKYVDSTVFQLEDDRSYKLKPSEYKEIYKTCYA